jgi:hypothetical protein
MLVRRASAALSQSNNTRLALLILTFLLTLRHTFTVLIEGVLFNVKYLGSTHTECEGRGEKEDRIHQAELAVHEVKVSLITF